MSGTAGDPRLGTSDGVESLDIELTEWRAWPPQGSERGRTVHLEQDAGVLALAERLTRAGMLEVQDLRQGLVLQATSFVGTLRLGHLRVTVRPKLEGAPLLALLRYAYGLRDLALLGPGEAGLASLPFQELLIHQFLAEAEELVHRGLHRSYVRRAEPLESPRGKIDLGWWMRHGGTGQSRVQCTHHPRAEDTLLNRVLRGGVRHAASLTRDRDLRTRLHRLDSRLEVIVAQPLRWESLEQARSHGNRMTVAYQPALSLLALLLEGQGTGLEGGAEGVEVPGFLFDMNRFFQALLGRFLREHLPEHTVVEEHRLRGLMEYVSNPRGRRAPTPRPDFAVLQGARVKALLDAKYRDLWETPLPREMLYQLALYALSQGPAGRATILYPSMDGAAVEQVVALRDVVRGAGRATVVLRPVLLPDLARLVAGGAGAGDIREREAFARLLALGK